MKVKALIILHLLLLPIGKELYAQKLNLDSLIILSNEVSDLNQKASILNQIGNELRYTDYEKALLYVKESEKLSKELKNKLQLAESYIIQGIIWHKKKNSDSSSYYLQIAYDLTKKINYFEGIVKSLNSMGLYAYYDNHKEASRKAYAEALDYIDQIDNQKLKVMLYNNLAMLNKSEGEYDKAIEYYYKALNICDEIKFLRGAGVISSNLGLLYEKQKEHETALYYLNRSLEIRRYRKNRKGESFVLNNLGVVYEGIGEFEKALKHYKSSLEIKKELGLLSGIERLYNNIGIIHKELHNYDSAMYYYNKSIEISKNLKNEVTEARTVSNIAQLNYKLGDYNNAVANFNKSKIVAEKNENIEELVKIYKGLSKSYGALKEYEKAWNYEIKYGIYYDSIYNLTSKKYFEEIRSKYQNIKKEKENQQLQQVNLQQSEQLKRQIILSIFGSLVTFLILVILIIVFRTKIKLSIINKELILKNKKIHKQSKELEKAYKSEKTMAEFRENLTSMIAHDLKNPLNFIMYSSLNYKKDKNIVIQHAAKQMLNLISNMIDVYKSEYAKLELDVSETKLTDIVNETLNEVNYLLSTQKQQVKLNNLDKDYVVNVDKEVIKRVLINLLTNAIKFSPIKGIINLNFEFNYTDKYLYVGVNNKGDIISKEKQEYIFDLYKQDKKIDLGLAASSGLGLAFCKLAIIAHSGKIGIKSNEEIGTEFWFILPGSRTISYKKDNNFKIWSSQVKLSEEEKDYLKPYANEIKVLDIWEISSINSIIHKIEKKSENITNWLDELNESIYKGDKEKFMRLTNLE